MRLLGVGAAELENFARKAEVNDHSGFPGLPRISAGLYNTRQEADCVAETIRDLLDRGPRERYVLESHRRIRPRKRPHLARRMVPALTWNPYPVIPGSPQNNGWPPRTRTWNA
jgi:hypothetical protein